MPYINVDALVGDGPVAPPPTLNANGSRVSENAQKELGAFSEIGVDDPTRVAWRANYTAELARVLGTPAKDYHDSAARLSGLVKSALLEFRHLKTDPSKFFEAHRLLVNHGFEQGPGFSIRFTVQYNLFAGTVLELGGPKHLRALEQMQRDGELGCFALTEKLAGHPPRRRVQELDIPRLDRVQGGGHGGSHRRQREQGSARVSRGPP
jgi:acyl-CoA oxidase